MAPDEPRRRQIEQAVIVLEHQAAAFLGDDPVFARDVQRRAHARGLAGDDLARLAYLRGDDGGYAGFQNACLFAGDFRDAVAEVLDVIERNRGDHRGERLIDHVGGVEATAQSHFQQQHVGRMPRKQHEPHRGRDLEHRDRHTSVDALAFVERVDEFRVAHQHAPAGLAEAITLVHAHEVRRGVGVDLGARRFQHRAHERDGRAFAVGAGDVDHRRQPALRMAELREDALHAVEGEVDPLGVQRQ